MKVIKISLLFLVITSLVSCLKAKNDFGGLLNDKGGIVVSITEMQYLHTDAHVIGFGFFIFTNFNMLTANEDVKFFTLHISQPRETKMSGPMSVTITMAPLAGYTAPPAGGITIPATVTIPASGQASFDFPVKFAVNKSLFNPANHYGATFTVTSVSQGVVSEADASVDVYFNGDLSVNNTSRFTGRYQWTSTVVDPAGQYGIQNNKKPVNLEENVANRTDIFDFYAWALSANAAYRFLWANNLSTGTNTSLFAPRYVFDANGNVTSIINQSATAAVTNIQLDPGGANKFVYTANDDKKLEVKYTFDLTTTINSVVTTRKVTVTESFVYDPIQAYY